MKTAVTSQLRRDVARYALRFACEDCLHFATERDECVHGYPASPRRDGLRATAHSGEAAGAAVATMPPGTSEPSDARIEFCKEFELGDPPDRAAARQPWTPPPGT